MNINYYLKPNEWLSQKAQYFLALDKQSLYAIYCEIDMEEEFLSDEDLTYFKERYGELAFKRYLLMKAKDKGDLSLVQKLEAEIRQADPNNLEFALPSLYEMLAYVQSDKIHSRLMDLAGRLSDEDPQKQRLVSDNTTTARIGYFSDGKFALPAPSGATNDQLQTEIRDYIKIQKDIDNLQAAAQFLLQKDPYSNDHNDVLVSLFWQGLNKYLEPKGLRNAFINMSRDSFKLLLRTINAQQLIKDRIEELERGFMGEYQIKPEQVLKAIESLTDFETLQFVHNLNNAQFDGMRYPDGFKHQYTALFRALEAQGIPYYKLSGNNQNAFHVIRAIIKYSDCETVLRSKKIQLEKEFLARNKITVDKIHAVIRALSCIEAVEAARDILDGIMVKPQESARIEIYRNFRSQGITTTNMTLEDMQRALELTSARPVIEERMRAYSAEIARIAELTESAASSVSQLKAFGMDTADAKKLPPPYTDQKPTGTDIVLHNQKGTDASLALRADFFLRLLNEIKEFTTYKDDPAAVENMLRRLRIIINETEKILDAASGTSKTDVISIIEKIKKDAENMLNQILSNNKNANLAAAAPMIFRVSDAQKSVLVSQ